VSAGTVRAVIKNYLTAPPITGLQGVSLDAKWYESPFDWKLAGNLGWGALGIIHFDHREEKRLTYPAVYGSKEVTYNVGLGIMFRYLIPSRLPPGTEPDVWVTHLDDLIEGIIARIRADQTLGSGEQGVVFQAGENSPDIILDQDLPRTDSSGAELTSWNLLKFTVTEIVRG